MENKKGDISAWSFKFRLFTLHEKGVIRGPGRWGFTKSQVKWHPYESMLKVLKLCLHVHPEKFPVHIYFCWTKEPTTTIGSSVGLCPFIHTPVHKLCVNDPQCRPPPIFPCYDAVINTQTFRMQMHTHPRKMWFTLPRVPLAVFVLMSHMRTLEVIVPKSLQRFKLFDCRLHAPQTCECTYSPGGEACVS